MPRIVMTDRRSKCMADFIVPKKGVDEYAVEKAQRWIEVLGYSKLILKSDQEPALLDLKRAIMATATKDIIPEESPVGESQSKQRWNMQLKRHKDRSER